MLSYLRNAGIYRILNTNAFGDFSFFQEVKQVVEVQVQEVNKYNMTKTKKD